MIKNAATARNKSDDVNSKSCKVLFTVIEETAEKGEYSLILDKEMVPEHKKNYLIGRGFTFQHHDFANGNYKKWKISW